jgi:hypothetical protein
MTTPENPGEKGYDALYDAGVISGPISNEEIDRRSAHGYTQFVPQGFNEELLEAAGFRIIGLGDRTASVELNARGRLSAMCARKPAFEALEGKETFEREQRYLETVIELSKRRALTRVMYFAELAAV